MVVTRWADMANVIAKLLPNEVEEYPFPGADRATLENASLCRSRRILRPGVQTGAGKQDAGVSVSSVSQGWPAEATTPMAIPVSRCYSASCARSRR